jgi:hypothetical protein
MNLKNEIEPRMNTDETRINIVLSGKPAPSFWAGSNSRVTHGFISVYPCSSVAN